MKSNTIQLTCFKIANGARFGDKLPERIKLLNWGRNESVKKVHPFVDENTVAAVANLIKTGGDRIALDYEHNTVPDAPAFKESSEPRKVAGYGVPVVVPGDGLYLTDMVYTPSGTDNAREYIDLSPAVVLDEETGTVIGLHSAALCRHGAVKDLTFYSIENPRPTQGESDMDEATKKTIDNLTKRLAAIEKNDNNAEQIEALSADIAALTEKVETFNTDFRSELDKRDKANLINQATAAGKVVNLTDKVLEKFSVDELSAHIEKLPVTVPLSRNTPAKSKPGEGATIFEQFSAIEDPKERAAFFKKHKEEL